LNKIVADIVLGLQHGDEGKGKVTHHLLGSGEYTHCIRFNGGCNAGHTIYHNGEKFVTHHIPAGVFYGVKSIIGPGCVLNIKQFFKELKELKEGGIETKGNIFIARNAHVITDEHLEEDKKDTVIGTTRTGNGPAYRAKYGRTGILAQDIPELKDYIIDLYNELYLLSEEPVVLFEGAQGFALDVDWGDYPYVTSSHCTTAGAMLCGVSPKSIRNVFGVAKAYETYVGTKEFQPKGEVFNRLREVGEEYGATTGRPRQCNWMDLALLDKAVTVNGVTQLIFNKMDILRKVGNWTININSYSESRIKFQDEATLKSYLIGRYPGVQVLFSENPERI